MPTGILEMDPGHKSFTATVGVTKTKIPSARSFIRPDIAAASLKVICPREGLSQVMHSESKRSHYEDMSLKFAFIVKAGWLST